jgi:hypothetical protein
MLRRVAFNGLLFVLLLAGIGVFTRARTGGPEITDIVASAALGGVWAGVLVAIVEVKLVGLEKTPRLLLSALCGALAYVGLFVAMGTLAGVGVKPELLALGAALGAASHAVRASIAAAHGRDDDDH